MAKDLHAKFRKQTATVWVRDGVDSALAPSFDSASPRQILVRWEQRVANFVNRQGESQASAGTVILGEVLSVGDWLFLGTSAEADPTELIGAHEIMAYQETPSPSGLYVSRVAFLSFRRVL